MIHADCLETMGGMRRFESGLISYSSIGNKVQTLADSKTVVMATRDRMQPFRLVL